MGLFDRIDLMFRLPPIAQAFSQPDVEHTEHNIDAPVATPADSKSSAAALQLGPSDLSR